MKFILIFAVALPFIKAHIVQEHFWEPGMNECMKKYAEWKTIEIDPSFMAVGKKLFYPYMSRQDLNRKSACLLRKEVKDLDEASLYYDSCIKVEGKAEDESEFTGFNGKKNAYKIIDKPDTPGFEGKYWRKVEDDGGYKCMTVGCHTKVTMTDNKTFAFMPDCAADGHGSWSVVSTVPKLDDKLLSKIYAHAQELGLKKEYFTSIRYDNCK